jgi:single-strand DNA-binding protein
MIINTAILGGRVTRDPELKVTPSGKSVVTLGVAYNPPPRTVAGKKVDSDPVFVDVQVWGKAAERAAARFQKGSSILVQGELAFDDYLNAEKERRTKLYMKASSCQAPHTTNLNYCTVVISGNLTQDPTLSEITKGRAEPMAISTASLAHNGLPYEDAAGQKHEPKPVYVDAVCTFNNAVNLVKFQKKGNHVLVDGSLYLAKWTDKKTGNERQHLKLSVDRILFLNRETDKAKGEAIPATYAEASNVRDPAAAPAGVPADIENDVGF